jgi:hypothetical protein
MYHEKPALILYRLNLLQWVGKWFVMTCRFITLVNLLATDDISRRASRPGEATGGDPRVPYPEFPWYRNPAKSLAALAVRWLRDPVELERRRGQLAALKAKYAQSGATARAASYLLSQLGIETQESIGVDCEEQELPATLQAAAAAAACRAAHVPVDGRWSELDERRSVAAPLRVVETPATATNSTGSMPSSRRSAA